MKISVEKLAKICYEANKAYCECLGDFSTLPWDEVKQSTIAGVNYILNNDNKPHTLTSYDMHEAWLRHKLKEGWKYGPVKDLIKKEHPCCLAYNDLTTEHKQKDELFLDIVRCFSQFVDQNSARFVKKGK